MPSSPSPRVRIHPETFAITAVTHQRHRIFQRSTNADLLLNTLFRYRDQSRYQLHGFVIMPDHIHALLTPAPDQTIERCVQLIKGGFSFAIRKDFQGEVWQDGYHAHRITDINDYQTNSNTSPTTQPAKTTPTTCTSTPATQTASTRNHCI